jgi:exodeoxyribonuclease VII large subunit
METPGETLDLLAPARDVYTVSRLNRTARDAIEQGLGSVWVEGELSNVARPSSGHLYWTLKDSRAQVRCAMFRQANRRLGFAPEDGQQVLLRGRVSLYEARGEFQIAVDFMEEAGEGVLRRKFEALKARLKAEGLFEAAVKRTPPRLPRRIGVITSPTGAALRDVLHVLGRRFPAVPVTVYPTPVQGAGAAADIAATLELAEQRGECDVLLLVRGGGSLEDLWSFNDEALARTLFALTTPVIAGVGHEVDFTIADFVADLRAPTPSGAAELAVPDAAEWQRQFATLTRRLGRTLPTLLSQRQMRYQGLSRRLASVSPAVQLAQGGQRLDELEGRLLRAQESALRTVGWQVQRLGHALAAAAPRNRVALLGGRLQQVRAELDRQMSLLLEQRRTRLRLAARALEGLSPLATLARGYAIVTRSADQGLVSDADQVTAEDLIDVRLARGGLKARVLGHQDPDPQAKNSATAGRKRSMSTRKES